MACSDLKCCISIGSVHNDGFPGVVVSHNRTFLIFNQQVPAAGTGHRPDSFVKPTQFPSGEDEETPMDWDPPMTGSDSQDRNGAPSNSASDEEIPMEWE